METQHHPKKTAAPKKPKSPQEKETHGKEPSEEDKKTGGQGTPEPESADEKELTLIAKALEEKIKEAASHYEQLLRVRAEFENFKKRQAKEQSQFLKYSNENLIRSLLPAISNLERANEATKTNQDSAALRVGVEMILRMFYDVLKQAGVEAIECAGQAFDPNKHEVISCVESADHEENMVIQEFEKGYFLHDRLLCPAKVMVSKKPQDQGKEKPQTDSGGNNG